MKRRAITCGALAILLMQASPSPAQDAVALAVEGWRQTEKNGIVYYRCDSSVCASGSVVSYKFQPHRAALTLAEFEKHHQALAEANRNTGRIKGVTVSDPKERTIEGVRVLQVSREVDWDDGTHTSTIEARLIGPQRSASVVSDSPKQEWTGNNFEGFLRSLVPIMGIAQP